MIKSQEICYNIGKGFELIPFVSQDKKQNNYFCRLYKNGILVDNFLYRQGGFFTGFTLDKEEHDYCSIIQYKNEKDYGTNVIINTDGKVVLKSTALSYPYLIGGILGGFNKNIFNLKTGEIICQQDSGGLKSKEFYFVEQNFGKIYSAKSADGVYKINLKTGEVEFFGKK